MAVILQPPEGAAQPTRRELDAKEAQAEVVAGGIASPYTTGQRYGSGEGLWTKNKAINSRKGGIVSFAVVLDMNAHLTRVAFSPSFFLISSCIFHLGLAGASRGRFGR
jgi:hypothetical protein